MANSITTKYKSTFKVTKTVIELWIVSFHNQNNKIKIEILFNSTNLSKFEQLLDEFLLERSALEAVEEDVILQPDVQRVDAHLAHGTLFPNENRLVEIQSESEYLVKIYLRHSIVLSFSKARLINYFESRQCLMSSDPSKFIN